MKIVKIATIKIKPNRQRQEFDPTALLDLQQSIQLNGLQHPIVIREEGNDMFLVSGERRLKALSELAALGCKVKFDKLVLSPGTLPVVSMGELDELAAEEAELDENFRRKDLSWQEHSRAVARLEALRTKQAAREGKSYTIAELSQELKGSSKGSAQSLTKRDIILAKNLDNKEVASAKTPKEAFTILRREADREINTRLAAELGATYNSDVHEVFNQDCLIYMADPANFNKFDIILTDPLYGINAHEFNDGADRHNAMSHNYDDSYENWQRIMKEWSVLSYKVCKEQAHAYVFCDIDRFHELRSYMHNAGWYTFRTPLIYVKKNSGRVPLPDRGPRRQYEIVLYCIKGKKQVTHIYPDVFEAVADQTTGHGAQKPVSAWVNLLQRSARVGDYILDPFAGSGGVLEAGHKFKCKVTAIELEPSNYTLCVKRLKTLDL